TVAADAGALPLDAAQLCAASDYREHPGICFTRIRLVVAPGADHACGRGTRSAHTDASTRRRNEIPDHLALLECAAEYFACRGRSENYKGPGVSAEKQF